MLNNNNNNNNNVPFEEDEIQIIKTSLDTFVVRCNTDTNNAMKNIVYSCLNNNLLKFHFPNIEQARLLLIQLEDAQAGEEVAEILESIDYKYNIFE